MSTQFYNKMKVTVENLLSQYGQPCTLKKFSSTHNIVTNEVTQTTIEQDTVGALFPSSRISEWTTEEVESLVATAIVQPIPTIKIGDNILFKTTNKEYKVIWLNELQPAGINLKYNLGLGAK